MGWVATTIMSILGIIAVGVTIGFGVYVTRVTGSISVPHNLPLVENCLPEFARGHTDGLELKVDKKRNGNMIVTMLPSDVEFRDNLEFQPDIKPVRFVVGKGYRIPLAKGEFSTHRTKVKYNHKYPNEISERYNATQIGEILSKEAIINKVENRLRQMEREGDLAISNLVREHGKGELSRKKFAESLTIMNELFKAKTLEQHEEKKK